MRKFVLTAVAVLALAATGAWAQGDIMPLPTEPMEPTPAIEPAKGNQPSLLTDFGMAAEIGGGVFNFVDSNAARITNPGGDWTARLLVGTRTHLAGELAYVGSAQGLTALGVEDRAVLMSNGINGNVRVNILTGDWQPYAAVGYTWRRYQIQNSSFNTSSVASAENVNEVPLSIGLAYRYKGFIADVRLNLNNAFASDLLVDTNLTTMGATAKVGFEF